MTPESQSETERADCVGSTELVSELEAALETLRKITRRLKKQKRMDIWSYVDDAVDFVEEALLVERRRSDTVAGQLPATGGPDDRPA